MAFITAAIVGGAATLAGSAISAGAAGSAARTQAKAAERSANLQEQQFNRGVELQEPFRQAGIQGQNKLMTLLGLGGTPQYNDVEYNKALQNYNAQLSNIDRSQFMSGGGGSMVSTGSDGMEYYQPGTGGTFDEAGYNAARAGIVAPNREQFRLPGGDTSSPDFGKYSTAEFKGIPGFDPASLMQGYGGITGFDPASLMKDYGGVEGYDPSSAFKDFTMSDFQEDPGYGFRLKEGLKAVDSQAAARGGLISGGALKASQRYGQDMASQEYQNAFNRYQGQRAFKAGEYQNDFNRFQNQRTFKAGEYQNDFNRFQADRGFKAGEYQNAFNRFQSERTGTLNPYQSLAGQGQTTSNALANMGNNYATQAGNTLQAGANAQASGYVGQANAINQGIGNITNQYYQNQMLNRVFPEKTASTAGGWTS